MRNRFWSIMPSTINVFGGGTPGGTCPHCGTSDRPKLEKRSDTRLTGGMTRALTISAFAVIRISAGG